MSQRPKSHRLNRDRVSWTAEDDAVLVASWPDPDLDFAAITKLVSGPRTAGAIKHRGYKIGLGPKAQRKRAKNPAEKLVAWPDDMPDFEDHPDAAASGPRSKAARLGSHFRSFTQDGESSLTGSSLDGAAIHPTGRRV